VTGCNEWQNFDEYPTSQTRMKKLYLSSQGRANTLCGDGVLVEAISQSQRADKFVYDPQDPVPLNPFPPGGSYGEDRRALEHRNDILVFTGKVLDAPLRVIGQIGVELFAASDGLDTDFTASLIDVYPDGRAVVLGPRIAGIIRARYRKGLESTELLTPGQVEKYRIDLGHIAHEFQIGHCVRLEISSSAAPLYNPNQNTGNPVATDREWRVAHQIIYHDEQHPSALVLPVYKSIT
jgi:putative CocE/NonD family hydrolase